MSTNAWFFFGGFFFLLLVLGDRWFRHGPVSPAIIYLILGFLLGPHFLNVLELERMAHPKVMELVAEVVVIISLFSAGLKLQAPFKSLHWKISLILASVTMVFTVALLAVLGHYLLNLPWAVAILMGGILAPTDPVLASDVQVEDEDDKDRVRRGLTGEAGLNDGSAFPVIMLGLTLMGARWVDSDMPLLNWTLLDFLWAIPGGIAAGALCGWATRKFVTSIRSKAQEKLIIEDFVSIGLIGVSYGLAQVISTYGFLAVFAAGVCFAREEKKHHAQEENTESYSASLIRFSTQLERIGELATVLFVGFIAGSLVYTLHTLLIPIFVFLLIRPIAVFIGIGRFLSRKEYAVISWFGIRGIGSIYYLYYALNHGLEGDGAVTVYNAVMVTIVVSVFVHGISASPIMRLYERR